MELIHLANVNSTNIGNGALICGLERVYAEDLPTARLNREPWDDYTFGRKAFDREFVRRVNASHGLIVNGAVAINGRAYLGHAGMRLDLPLSLWREIERPVVFHGISYRHWAGTPFHHLDRLKEVLAHILGNRKMLLAVRNDGTREWLAGLAGIAPDLLAEVPDSGIFVAPRKGDDPEIVAGRTNIVLAVNNEDATERYAGRKEHVLAGIVGTLVKLAEQRNANLILAPHYLDDFRMVGEIFERLPPRIAHQHVITTGLARVDAAGRFYGRYAQMDLVLAMRVHAMSPAIGMGVPLVVLASQGRMSNFLRKVGLSELGVDVFAEDFADRLWTAVERTLAKPEVVRGRLQATAAALRADMRAFIARVAALLAG
ncbi:MAG: polysaccharide pyruvyl transferase family protein [Proteobacteria bacterium]|nr:polysaccharide pyruvyl transferase family protein [Pseudomonadota bacterium]